MEGSVKSLIEAEEEARKIVEQAQQDKLSKVKEADTTAQQVINLKQQAYEKTYRAEESKVRSISYCTERRRAHCPEGSRFGSGERHGAN